MKINNRTISLLNVVFQHFVGETFKCYDDVALQLRQFVAVFMYATICFDFFLFVQSRGHEGRRFDFEPFLP